MHRTTNDQTDAIVILRKSIPPSGPVTDDEIERRREVVHRMIRIRERIGPIGIRADDLLHEARTESE